MATATSSPIPDPIATQIDPGKASSTESVLTASTGDQPTGRDTIGFEPYVKALASFLTHKQTQGPLTVSIEGEWGSGKSSFMMQLEKELLRLKPQSGPEGLPSRAIPPPLTIRFNPWRHEKEDAVWAAFAVNFSRQISEKLPAGQRWKSYGRLMWLRFDWREGWVDAVRLALILLVVAISLVLLPIAVHLRGWTSIGAASQVLFPVNQGSTVHNTQEHKTAEQLKAQDGAKAQEKPGNSEQPKPEAFHISDAALKKLFDWGTLVGGAVGYGAVLLSLWLKLLQYVKNPLAIDLKKYLDSPNYKERISFIEKFHEDFQKIVNACAGNRRVFVFVDDLDRCEVPKAAELMQALNLMISSDPRLIFILAMDREKIAAGVAVKNKDLLPYLREIDGADGQNGTDEHILSVYGIEFGHEFVEKFIQVPFLVPQATEPQLEYFLGEISKPPPTPRIFPSRWLRLNQWLRGTQWLTLRELSTDEPALASGQIAETATPNRQQEKSKTKTEQWHRFYKGEDSRTLREIVLTVAPVFDNNPRRLKQFVNLFRLKTFVAAETGLFDFATDAKAPKPITLQQLGKFTALLLRWPLLVNDLKKDNKLLAVLDKSANGVDVTPKEADGCPALPRWRARADLKTFLQMPSAAPGVDRALWSMASVDVEKLLRVSPPVHTLGDKPNEVKTEITDAPANSSRQEPNAPLNNSAAPTDRSPDTDPTARYDVYLSFRSEDRSVVGEIVGVFQSSGLKVFWDQEMSPGTKTAAVINDAIENSNTIVFCLSRLELSKMQVMEISSALQLERWRRGTALIPILLPGAEPDHMPSQLQSLQWFDYRNGNPDTLAKLVETIRRGSEFQPKKSRASSA